MSCRLHATLASLLCTIFAAHPSVHSTARGQQPPAAAFPDAQLNDVCGVGAGLQWAVGDRGTILHSDDGGQSWSLQATPVDARLTSVSFVDEQIGWAVGGRTRPHTLGSAGVVLATRDGGQSWEPMTRHALPALVDVRFFSARQGIAVGRASSMQASGIFVTDDGGKMWQAIPGGRGWSWQTGDFIDPFTGAVAGRGLWAGIDRRVVKAPAGEPPRARAIRDLHLVPPVHGWAVGDGGLVLTTPDLGQTWFEPPATLPDSAARHFDLQAVAVQGTNVWVAGTPGTRIFHSPDAGRTWNSVATGVAAPITALHFVDAERGTAVGGLGTIVTTRDGGRSWQVARRGASRSPLLAAAARTDAVPIEVLAHASAAEGYLATVGVLFREPPEDINSSPTRRALVTRAGDDVEGRLQDGVLHGGGTATQRAWQFPLPSHAPSPAQGEDDLNSVLAELNRRTDGRALQQLEAYLVRQIRIWRPDVIVVGASPLGPTAEGELTRELVLRSVEAAADPTRHIDLATDADLAPWSVQRVFAVASKDATVSTSIRTNTFVTHLGHTIADVAERARGVLGISGPPPDEVPLQQVFPAEGASRRLNSIFDGLVLAPGGDGRRAARAFSDEEAEKAVAIANKRRNVRAILTEQPGNIALSSHLRGLTEGLDDASQARVLYLLADGYRQEGQCEPAAEILERLIEEYPDAAVVDAAIVWLVQYYAGSETKWSIQATPDGAAADPAERAVAVAKGAAAIRPQLLLEPQVGVPLAAAYRKAGLAKEADRYMLLLRQRGAADAWQQLAEAERWLASPTEYPPSLPIWTCGRTANRPHLDGVLDEPFWRDVRPVRLKADSDIAQNERFTGASLYLAYDAEFLYLGIRGELTKPGEPSRAESRVADSAAADEARRRDAALTGVDRVHLALDLDRDLTTFYELMVDCRGRVHDQAWGDPRWNPTWYVAHAGDDGSWAIEAALPLAELTSGPPPQPRDVWCISACHLSADGGATQWHGPELASPTAASFGLLIFE